MENPVLPAPAADNPPTFAARQSGALRISAVIFLLSVTMHLPWIGMAPLAGTEGLRVLPAHEMVRSGWWLVPLLYNRVYLGKPPLHYWLIALAEKAGGANPVAWRVPSVLTGALLCAACCWFGWRWFGRRAGIISGFCALGLIALWGQSQVAEIDATDTLAAALAGFCGIELYFGRPRPPLLWTAAAGLAIAAAFMTKGPGGLPILLGVWIWAAVTFLRESRPERLLAPAFWSPLLTGLALFGLYFLAVKWSLRQHGMPADLSGVIEGTNRLHPRSIGLVFKALSVTPPQLIAFTVPLSLGLLLIFNPEIKQQMPASAARVATALAASVLVGFAVLVLSATDNPRYGYTVLPPLCPLAAAVAVAAMGGRKTERWLRQVAQITAGLLAAAAVALSVMAWRQSSHKQLLIASATFILLGAGWTIHRLCTSWRAAWGLAAVMLLTVVPFSLKQAASRARSSGSVTAETVRNLTGGNALIGCGGVVSSKPEIFYYSGSRVLYFPSYFSPGDVRPEMWVILDDRERRKWLRDPAVRLQKEAWIMRNGSSDYYLAWYTRGDASGLDRVAKP